MIEHADNALEQWLRATAGVTTVEFGDTATSDTASSDTATSGAGPSGDAGSAGSRRSGATAPVARITLLTLAEKVDRRDREVADVRDGDGRVTARQRALRWFELDYRIAIGGDPRDAHQLLGALVQALVDDDVIAAEHLPEALGALDVPLEIELRSAPVSGRDGPGITVRLVVPVRPRADVEIAEPVHQLDLEMSPPPRRRAGPGTDDEVLLADRKWTTVRRREMITAPSDHRPEASA